MPLHTCVSPKGRFIYGIHKPSFRVANQRGNDLVEPLGLLDEQGSVTNKNNFPAGQIEENEATWIYEIPNPFPFRGTTFIKKDWADRTAADPTSIKLPSPPDISLSKSISRIINSNDPGLIDKAFGELPQTVLLAMATTSNDPADLVLLANLACPFHEDSKGEPKGLQYKSVKNGPPRPLINDPALFEALVNNPYLPDNYKTVMVLRPGAQGDSEIVGEFRTADGSSHVYEYLRRNSYIAWGHYASNMADDAVRYSINSLSKDDIGGLRHLYYQRTFIRLANELGLDPAPAGRTMTGTELEELRRQITDRISESPRLSLCSTIWGWNYGFDFAPSGYRLHASHQQIHQQYAMLPGRIADNGNGEIPAYGCGDLVADFTSRFHEETGRSFFGSYIEAIRSNSRIDKQKDRPASLIVHEDERVMLFVPKAQTSQWELQLVCLDQVGNILEADRKTRESLDLAILTAMKVFDSLGVRMVTTIEFPKRFDSNDRDQRLLYSFLPKLPESPGAFSEAQLRWINGHYPEDFAFACRKARKKVQI